VTPLQVWVLMFLLAAGCLALLVLLLLVLLPWPLPELLPQVLLLLLRSRLQLLISLRLLLLLGKPPLLQCRLVVPRLLLPLQLGAELPGPAGLHCLLVGVLRRDHAGRLQLRIVGPPLLHAGHQCIQRAVCLGLWGIERG